MCTNEPPLLFNVDLVTISPNCWVDIDSPHSANDCDVIHPVNLSAMFGAVVDTCFW